MRATAGCFIGCRKPPRLVVLDTSDGKPVADSPSPVIRMICFMTQSGSGCTSRAERSDRCSRANVGRCYQSLGHVKTAAGARTSFYSLSWIVLSRGTEHGKQRAEISCLSARVTMNWSTSPAPAAHHPGGGYRDRARRGPGVAADARDIFPSLGIPTIYVAQPCGGMAGADGGLSDVLLRISRQAILCHWGTAHANWTWRRHLPYILLQVPSQERTLAAAQGLL